MLRYQILYNRSYSSSTQTVLNQQIFANQEEAASEEETLFKSQQELVLEREYYSYETQTGVGLVNDLNVKSYLNNPANESIALEFLSYLTGTTSLEEFRDIYYDNKKLAEYFNDYYRKIKVYSNQGVTTRTVDPSIDLVESKNRLIGRDRLYTKTNPNTGYIAQNIGLNGMNGNLAQTNLIPTDTINFSGDDESYYINIPITRKRIDFYSDDFREYFRDCCDGNIIYNRYTYYNGFTENSMYLNFEALVQRQNQFGRTTGPDPKSVKYLKSLLPVNFLNQKGEVRSMPLAQPSAPIQTNQGQNSIIILPQNNSSNSLNNFEDFNQFQTFFNFQYQGWTPYITNSIQTNQKYIYQQIVDLVMQTNSLFTQQIVGGSGSMASMQNVVYTGPPDMVLCEFSFFVIPSPFTQNYLGKKFDDLVTNQYTIGILNASPQTPKSVILKYESFSSVSMGPDDGFNYVSFDSSLTNDPYQTEITVNFIQNQSYKPININIYKSMQDKVPMVFSLRPSNNPNQICQYIIIYLEKFYQIKTYNFYDEIKVTQSEICKLMYNCFVDKKFDDNFLEIQRPDEFPVKFQNNQGFFVQKKFTDINVLDINNKLLNLFYNQTFTFYTISTIAGVPESGIYNIYTWGSYLFGTDDAFSDVDLIVVADGQDEIRQVKRNGVDIAIYNPTGFQRELSEFVSKIFNGIVPNDRVFTVFNSTDDRYKILERIKFVSNVSKQTIKTKAKEFKDERWAKAEEAFAIGDVDAYQKRLWSIFRNLIFAIQYVKNGKIDDITAANGYLNSIKSTNFQTWGQAATYFTPRIQLLYSRLLAL